MTTSIQHTSSWQITLSANDQHVILEPCIAASGLLQEPVQRYAVPLTVARMLQEQLAQSIRLLEQQVADATGPAERRSAERPVSHNRRKARPFEGSPSSRTDAVEPHDGAAPPKTEE